MPTRHDHPLKTAGTRPSAGTWQRGNRLHDQKGQGKTRMYNDMNTQDVHEDMKVRPPLNVRPPQCR